MAELKTKPNNKSVNAFIKLVETKRQEDCQYLLALMQDITGNRPKMWGDSIVGFGKYHYKYKSGREGDWFITGFSPRKQNLTIYIMPGFANYSSYLSKLGKYKTSVSCLYVKKLEDIDLKVLKRLVAKSVKDMAKLYKSA